MASTLFNNISSLVTNTDADFANPAFIVEDGKISWIGEASAAPAADSQVGLESKTVIPGFVDSHAHLMFAGDRAEEFSARMQGQAYSAGGIKTTVAATREASDAQLEANLSRLVAEMHASGITTFETKSGYGLDVETESRSLAIAAKHTSETTFLGAHVVPQEFKDRGESGADEYVELVKTEPVDIPFDVGYPEEMPTHIQMHAAVRKGGSVFDVRLNQRPTLVVFHQLLQRAQSPNRSL